MSHFSSSRQGEEVINIKVITYTAIKTDNPPYGTDLDAIRTSISSNIDKLYKALDEASQRGWVVVDMKEDWRRVYPKDK